MGIESNSFCESYAWQRLQQSNKINLNNIQLNDYLISYPENLSYIRSDSIKVIVLTNKISVKDHEQTIKEIYRVLKKVSKI